MSTRVRSSQPESPAIDPVVQRYGCFARPDGLIIFTRYKGQRWSKTRYYAYNPATKTLQRVYANKFTEVPYRYSYDRRDRLVLEELQYNRYEVVIPNCLKVDVGL